MTLCASWYPLILLMPFRDVATSRFRLQNRQEVMRVKSSKLIMGCLATLGLTSGMALAQEDPNREAIAERLAPVGELCLEGEECGTVAAAPASNGGQASGGIDGADIYDNVCMACHETGAAGAPVRGDEDAWAGRLDKGWDELLANAINGIGAMPAKGGNPNLSDEEVAAATAHLLEPVMDVPEVGGEEEAPAEEMAAAEGEEQAPAEEMEAAEGEEQASDEEMAAADGEEQAPAEGEAEEAQGKEMAAAEESTEEATDEATTEEAADGGNGLDGEALYGSSGCAACHDSGAAGAPVVGNAENWASRLEKGTEELYANAINGIGAMPPKGGNMNLSDEEVKAIVDYMIAESQ
jgi:cytochrome c5